MVRKHPHMCLREGGNSFRKGREVASCAFELVTELIGCTLIGDTDRKNRESDVHHHLATRLFRRLFSIRQLRKKGPRITCRHPFHENKFIPSCINENGIIASTLQSPQVHVATVSTI
ncbi:unnamed protein product [Arabidopsis lyrata]|nr:unnamed protein product [Arabidopsis lyrata]